MNEKDLIYRVTDKKSPADEAGQKLIDYGMMFSGHG